MKTSPSTLEKKLRLKFSDQKILIYARKFATQILEDDKNLSKEKNNKNIILIILDNIHKFLKPSNIGKNLKTK